MENRSEICSVLFFFFYSDQISIFIGEKFIEKFNEIIAPNVQYVEMSSVNLDFTDAVRRFAGHYLATM